MKQHFFILFAAAMLPFTAACGDDGFLKKRLKRFFGGV